MKILGVLLLGLFCIFGISAQTPKACERPNTFVIDQEKPSVYLEFEQFGKANDWGNAKLGEIGEEPKIEKGNDVWLRLYNNSCWEINVTTISLYYSKIPDPANPGKMKIAPGLIQNGSAANVIYIPEEKDGRRIPWGGDMYAKSRLASGNSLIFPVNREHLDKGRSIYLVFEYGWETRNWNNNLAPEHHAFFWGYRLEEIKKR